VSEQRGGVRGAQEGYSSRLLAGGFTKEKTTIRDHGAVTAAADPRLPIEKIGTSGWITPRRAIFAKDKHHVELAGNPERNYTVAILVFTAILERNMSGRTTLPGLLAWFPSEHLVARSVRLAV
jgi:hypothetical protein